MSLTFLVSGIDYYWYSTFIVGVGDIDFNCHRLTIIVDKAIPYWYICRIQLNQLVEKTQSLFVP